MKIRAGLRSTARRSIIDKIRILGWKWRNSDWRHHLTERRRNNILMFGVGLRSAACRPKIAQLRHGINSRARK